jgi:histidinol-phosphate aminotransferase
MLTTRRDFGRIGALGVLSVGAGALARSAAGTTPAITPIRLSANENPYGPSPLALEAMRDSMRLAWRYPDEAADALVDAIARLHRVSSDQVILGDGSSEILKLAAAAFLDSSHKLVVADPTFEAIASYARVTRAETVKVPLDATFGHDLPKMAAASGGLIYLCNPNNPTGSITRKQSVRNLLDATPSSTMVLIDEAYHHYAESPDYESTMPLVAIRPNLIVSRTFSKIYGMAGLRVGYAVAQADVIRKLQQQAAWDSTNVIGLAAARASLADAKHVADGKQRNSETKGDLVASLTKLGYSMIPSDTNFIMIDTRRDVKPLITALRRRGVQVGRLFPAMPHHLRVTIGTPQQMRQFFEAFRAAVA